MRDAINVNLTVARQRDKSPPLISYANYRQIILRARSEIRKPLVRVLRIRRMLQARRSWKLPRSLALFLSLSFSRHPLAPRQETARGVLTKPS